MVPRLELPNPEVSLTLDELTAVQAAAHSHITFSLTRACPLRCAHCIVDAAPELAKTTMPLEVAEYYAAQMQDLADYGIRNVSFTGGEPLLARCQLAVLSQAAGHARIASGVVTAAHWAHSAEAARQVVAQFPAIHSWDISADAFHEPFVPLTYVEHAYRAAIDAGRRVTIRYTCSEPPSAHDTKVLEFITTLEEASFSCQYVRPVGRGVGVPGAARHNYNPWVKPCLTQGMVVRYDGSIAPCCLNLVEDRNHPFQLGDARSRPLREVHSEYMAIPLLQMIRSIGFSELMRWLRDAGLDSRLGPQLPEEVCQICALMMRDPVIAKFLKDKAAAPETQLKIAVISARTLGEYQMLHVVTERFADASLSGYDAARQLVLHRKREAIATETVVGHTDAH